MSKITGRRCAISLPRRWTGDLMAVSAGIPLIPMERNLDVSALIAARRNRAEAPGWAALVVKAFALVSMRNPSLRRCYVRWPRPHFWEADFTIASVTVARDYDGELAVFFFHLRAPERTSLLRIQEHLNDAKTKPFDAVHSYRRLLRLSRWWQPLRRSVWAYGYHKSGRERAKYFGTFGLSTTASYGGRLVHVISPLAATITYGPIRDDGTLPVTLVFDHRVLDGAMAATALVELERTLNGAILDELLPQGERGTSVP